MRFTGKIFNVSRDRHGPWMVQIAGRYPGDPIDRFQRMTAYAEY